MEIPRNQLVAITGVSGSGKSSLAFDTLFREGQRRFLETLSSYARQFLGRMEKPDVDGIDGLSPAIAVDQKSIQRGPRSTVGTLTEIVDHLRLLFARAGVAHCPDHDEPLQGQTPEAVLAQILADFDGDSVHVLAPQVRDRKGHHKPLFAELARKGFVRVRVDGEVHRLEEVPELARYKRHTVEVVVDRLQVKASGEARVREALQSALEMSHGDVVVLGSKRESSYSTLRSCPRCGLEAPPLEPRLFSFNSPHGACQECDGLGLRREPSKSKVIRNPELTIREGCLAVTRANGGGLLFPRVEMAFLEEIGREKGFDLDTPWNELSAKARKAILHGTGQKRFADESTWNGKRFQGSVRWERRYRGIIPALERAWRKGYRRRMVERYLDVDACSSCGATRLNRQANAVSLGGTRWGEWVHQPVERLGEVVERLQLTAREKKIADRLLEEIDRRTQFLLRVGLGYLTLDRAADTLSGGEAQRIRLAAQLGAGLQGVVYVLDEPSIGLHARDQGRLMEALRALRDAGNTVVVVEHDPQTLRGADHLIDVGPGAGRNGGHIAGAGSPREIARSDSPTGLLLRGKLDMPQPEDRRAGTGEVLRLCKVSGFNLKGIDVEIPLGTLTVVTGVSGSGKSTLVESTLRRAVARHLGLEAPQPETVEKIEGLEHIEELVAIDAAPIGRTPRSNPATYSGAFTPIRDLFAQLPEARMQGWGPGRFSFNVAGGRCETCQGAGAKFVELQFLAPVTVPCEECGGHRFQSETLEVRYKGTNIADVLALTVEDALAHFEDLPKIARPLSALVEVGLGYVQLGQPSTTLSGGEAQRVKLAKHLQRRSRKHTLYLLDEPTTGLHQADVQRLVGALQKLVDMGHSVLVVEHDLDLIGAADWIVDLGPEGGERGGRLIAAGTPEELRDCADSYTGQAMSADRELAQGRKRKTPKPAQGLSQLSVRGARLHNLKRIDVDIPHDALTVITGPSGSGKSTLALDTIHEAGRQRFVESLSTYSRQFLGSGGVPPVDSIEGLGPSVAVEAKTSVGHPRSTVATTTEIHDHFRVLWARAGTRRCPEHGEKLEALDHGAIARRMQREFDGESAWISAPVFGPGIPGEGDLKTRIEGALEAWKKGGFVRVLWDGTERRIDDIAPDDLRAVDSSTEIDIVVDRLKFGSGKNRRVAEAVEQAVAIAAGRVAVVVRKGKAPYPRRAFHAHGACTECGFHLVDELEPRHFSFNTHVGACPTCDGLGASWQCDPDLLVDQPDRPLVAREQGVPTAVGGKLGRYLTKGKGYYEHLLRAVADAHGIDLNRPFEKLRQADRDLILRGDGARAQYAVQIEKSGAHYDLEESFEADWPGLCGHVDAWHKKAEDPEWRNVLERFMSRRSCPDCSGERLADGPRSVTLGRKRLPQVLGRCVTDVLAWIDGLRLPAARREAVEPVLEELRSRLGLLERVGLGYLTLDRGMSTLSGGEARRVRLSANLGSSLVGVCYVLDEPTVGLHPTDIDRLTGALNELVELGNTVVVVEHDEHLMERADYVIDIGPGSGRHGGEVVAAGTVDEVREHPTSTTAKALRNELRWDAPESARSTRASVGLSGAKLHNLKGVDFEAHYGEITGLCGPSGSGKSTLILDCLVPALREERANGRWRRVRRGGAPRLLVVDASPLGRTPSSVPATAVGLMDPLRELFTRTPEARKRGYGLSHFSFNSTKGRCQACEGKGHTKVEMQFLADLWLECEECLGRRYAPEILEVSYRGRSIADVLDASVDEALGFLAAHPRCKTILQTLSDVGLGYLSLGQSSTTLSIGEAQRVKLAAELLAPATGVKSVVVLDEPSTGLSASDVQHLLAVLGRLAQRGDAVILIEHHTGLLSACHRLVELGPGGGAAGGRIIAEGTPDELRRDAASATGPWLWKEPKRAPKKKAARRKRKKVPL